MKDKAERNLWLFTAVCSLWGAIFGLIGPFFVLRVEKISGGAEKLGIAFSIMILVQSATTYLAGRFSDKLGRKPFLFLVAYTDALVLFLYTVIDSSMELYLLQAFMGITNGVALTINTSLLGDLTVREKRGRVVGRFSAVVSLFSALGVSLSGYLVKLYGLDMLFYAASGAVAASTLLLVPIKEPARGPSYTENHGDS